MTSEMEKPVTRGELFGEFLPALIAQLDKRFEQIDKRFEQIDKQLVEFRAEVRADLATHTKSVGEDLERSIGLVDDRYNDLPARVSRLEAEVFKPTPLKRRRSR